MCVCGEVGSVKFLVEFQRRRKGPKRLKTKSSLAVGLYSFILCAISPLPNSCKLYSTSQEDWRHERTVIFSPYQEQQENSHSRRRRRRRQRV